MFRATSPSGTVIIGQGPEKIKELELKLNLSENGHRWSALGDALYKAHAKGDYQEVEVSSEEFFWLVQSL